MADSKAERRTSGLGSCPGLPASAEPDGLLAATVEPSGQGAPATDGAWSPGNPPGADEFRMSGADEELHSLFREFFNSAARVGPVLRGVWRPPTDVFETAEEVVVKVEVAGVSKKDLKVTFDKDCLLIRGHREEQFPEKTVAVTQMEVEYGVFERKLVIRQTVDADNIDATYNDGFLIVRLPKVVRRDRGSISVVV